MAKPILTKRKAKWAASHPKDTLRGVTLHYNASHQEKYVSTLTKLVRAMTEQSAKAVIKLFESETASRFYVEQTKIAMDADIASQARILTNKLANKFELLFSRKAPTLIEKMIRDTNRLSKANLHTSLKQLSGGLSLKTSTITGNLKTILKASVTENVALITSIAEEYQSKLQKLVMRSITSGEGLKTIIPALKKYEGISARHAEFVALDQTRKVYNSMNRGRMEAVGVEQFEWIHSGGGQKPREDHIEMSGNIYSFDDLPVIDQKTGERGIPGQAPGCRCTMRPVIKFNEGDQNAA